MKNHNAILTGAFLLLSLFSFSQNVTLSTEGTFQFHSPSGKTLFWRTDFIEDLYPEIENRREDEDPVYWEYNEDMTIIIYSKEHILSSDFVPVESPYKGISLKEIR